MRFHTLRQRIFDLFQADFAQTLLNRHHFINENTELHKKAVLWICPP